MKRLLIFVFSAILILSIVACSSPSTGNSSLTGSVPEGNGSISGESGSATSSSGSAISGNTSAAGHRVGLGFVSTTSESTAAATETPGNAQFSVAACAVTVDDGGKILDIKFDTVQANVGFDVTGAFTGDIKSEIKTKKEIGDAYGLKRASQIGKEWYEQIAALEDWMRGKTVQEALAIKVTSDKGAPEDDNLKTSVTISITDQLRALEKAYANAK